MLTWKFWRTSLVATGLVAIGAAPHFFKTRAQVWRSIPNRNYQFEQFSHPTRSMSAVGIPVQPTLGNDKAILPRIQAFQFVDMPVLQSDHCSLSQMSVLLQKNGMWTVSFRADQNPVNAVQQINVTPAEPRKMATSHLIRNEFHVRVTCYGGQGYTAGSKLGQPVIVPLELHPFWVQKGLSHPYYAKGYDERIKEYFETIDRVEIEFKYRNN